jgi:hypothetical protein
MIATWIPAGLSLLAAASVSVDPPQVPARGIQHARMRLDRAAMVHLRAANNSPIACTLIDQMRGPFASNDHCELDLLLDPGPYRVRLEAPTDAKGAVALTAQAFQEENPSPPRLDPGRGMEQKLLPQQQASHWVHLDARTFVHLWARGRTAGAVALWRDGEWLESLKQTRGDISPVAGQPIHEWQLAGWLEKGDYLMTVYGTSPLDWTRGAPDDTVTVGNELPDFPTSGSLSTTLPAVGVLAFGLPFAGAVATLELDPAPAVPAELLLHAVRDKDGIEIAQSSGHCRVEARSLVPQCMALSQSGVRALLEIRGAPGTPVRIRAERFASWPSDGQPRSETMEFGPPSSELKLRVPRKGAYTIETKDVPPDPDAAPLSCLLIEDGPAQAQVVAHDTWRIDPARAEERSFNTDGTQAVIGFFLADARDMVISTTGERQSRCELYRVESRGRTRLGSSQTEGQPCRLSLALAAGIYELQLDGGSRGIETVRLAPAALSANPASSPPSKKLGCQFAGVELRADRSYRVKLSRTGTIAARGLAVRPARSMPSAVAAWSPSRQPLPAFSPDLSPPARLVPGTARSFDFARDQSHSLLFEVKEVGLYALTSEGLLATECRLRTQTTAVLTSAAGTGRGRNCLIESYLRPGRYLATVTATGQSRGHAAVRLIRQSPRPGPVLTNDGQAFFAVPADEMVQQRIVIAAGGRMRLETHAPGATLACRFEDMDGWPLVPVPGPCRLDTKLARGRYLWTQFPLTVESRRQTRLARVSDPVVLKGPRPHPIAFNTWYEVQLDEGGKDRFLFDLEVDLDVQIGLTNLMQGRLLRVEPDGKTLIPVAAVAAQPQHHDETDGAAQQEEEGPNTAEQSSDEAGNEAGDEGGDEGGDENGDEGNADEQGADEGQNRRKERPAQVATRRSPPVATIRLPAGHYQLVTEHLHGSSEIAYRLFVGSDDLAPGMSKLIAVPFRARVRVPRSGVLHLSTEGQTDVRCRLYRAGGDLVAESAALGDDWNCHLAETIAAGDYTLVVEAEALVAGPSQLSLDMPSARWLGDLVDGSIAVERQPVELALPKTSATVLQAVGLRSSTPFSLALVDEQGRLVERRSEQRDGSFLLNARGGSHRLLLWTSHGSAHVQANRAVRAFVDSGMDGTVPAGAAARVSIARTGRYGLGRGLFCLAESERGVLRPCGPEASLEAGPTLFAAMDQGARESLALTERVGWFNSPTTETMILGRRPFVQIQRSQGAAVHLLRVRGLDQTSSGPACGLGTGVRALREQECLAASNVSVEAQARLSFAGPSETAQVTRFSLPWPRTIHALSLGETILEAGAGGARLGLPHRLVRAELLLPPEAWAVLLDPAGTAVDLCPPEKDLAPCVFHGANAGDILLWAPREGRVQVTLMAGEVPQRASLVGGLLELAPRTAGTLSVPIPASPEARNIEITGASSCAIRGLDGTRQSGCQGILPPQITAQVTIEHGGDPVRVLVWPRDQAREAVLFPAPAGPDGGAIETGQSVRLAGGLVTRTVVLAAPTVLRLRAASGVCALWGEKGIRAVEGLGDGCSLARLLEPGRYHIAVRGFADRPLHGTLSLLRSPIEDLGEGVGAERWIAPGETRLFRFRTRAPGRVGLGLQVAADTLDCAVLDLGHQTLGRGCQQLLTLEPGTYLLSIAAREREKPARFRPVLLGLAGSQIPVPPEYLEDLFQRSGLDVH